MKKKGNWRRNKGRASESREGNHKTKKKQELFSFFLQIGGAGNKMLYVLQTKKAENILIVVSRWYGGIQLGQMRYKHITDCTIEILDLYRKNKN